MEEVKRGKKTKYREKKNGKAREREEIHVEKQETAKKGRKRKEGDYNKDGEYVVRMKGAAREKKEGKYGRDRKKRYKGNGWICNVERRRIRRKR